ncbi:MAG TPA: adenylyltransferase/cytidyltransferase family protein [Candidatus Krumholzibacteria bacterium]|nr:adenylyltransferase/cytidyltransferase family protein [Candidatus Krumholzibacteria bacterium]HPD71481.1 adenylyltransferase/cytidyltransferase family protein [Candidatus Krumholzibacteria bacterium]HRY41586.1 adenylyltransferase/cytidyltransferase family protein [Candidatus Krumholzibacteria bacterium]
MREVDLGRVLALADVAAWAEAQRAAGLRIAFTNGCFDLVHVGHLWSLAEAARRADRLLVAINSDRSARELKGAGRPFLPEGARAALIAALRPVSAVTIFDAPTPLEAILQARPDVLVKGSEYEEVDIVGAPEVRSWGGEVIRVPMRAGWSTSSIIAAIRATRE